jgi:hypothetical protein
MEITKMRKIYSAILFSLLLLPMTAMAVCTKNGGSIVRVTYWADGNSSSHVVYYRQSATTNSYFYCRTADDNFAELASNALNGPTEVALSGTATSCPSSGSMGTCRYIVENP